jgi:hypothetical protein
MAEPAEAELDFANALGAPPGKAGARTDRTGRPARALGDGARRGRLLPRRLRRCGTASSQR